MAKKSLKRGMFITFEGVEGCGKSTHSKKIYELLRRIGFSVIYIREPGGTKIGEKIRKILLDPANKEMSDIAELFLFEANRAQIVKEVIRPALEKGKVVICDRFSDSTTAYQGYADSMDIGFVERLNKFASDNIEPDFTIVLDIGPKIGLRRVARERQKDRMEKKKLSYHRRVRQGYKKLAARHKNRIKLITVRNDMDKTQHFIRRQLLQAINRFTAKRINRK